MPKGGLTGKQKKFCDLIISGTPQYKAYLEAGYKAKTEGHARTAASKLVTKAHVREYLDQINTKNTEKTLITLDKVIQEYIRIAFFDIKDIVEHYNECGVTFKPIEKIDGKAIASIEEVHTPKGEIFMKIKPWDKMRALDKLYEYCSSIADPGEKSILKEMVELMRKRGVSV